MLILTLTAKFDAKEFETRYGTRLNARFDYPGHDDLIIWGPVTFDALSKVKKGQTYTVAIDSKGKGHLITEDLPKLKVDHALEIATKLSSVKVETSPSQASQASKPSQVESDVNQASQADPLPEVTSKVADLLDTQAALYTACLIKAKSVAKLTLDNPTNDDIRSIATTLFLSVKGKIADDEIVKSKITDDEIPF